MRVVVMAAVALALSGCMSTEKYKKEINTWVGSRETALVASWGAPNGSYLAEDGSRILTYVDWNGAHSMKCETTFVVRNSRVKSARANGSYCYSF